MGLYRSLYSKKIHRCSTNLLDSLSSDISSGWTFETSQSLYSERKEDIIFMSSVQYSCFLEMEMDTTDFAAPNRISRLTSLTAPKMGKDFFIFVALLPPQKRN